eukprot:SAG31_NODE_3541_length_4143_cov_2.731949_4_plen_74_part_00
MLLATPAAVLELSDVPLALCAGMGPNGCGHGLTRSHANAISNPPASYLSIYTSNPSPPHHGDQCRDDGLLEQS